MSVCPLLHRQDTLPLSSKGGNQAALVLVSINSQIQPISVCTSTYLTFTFFSFNIQPGYTHSWEFEEGQVAYTHSSNNIQHAAVQPHPLPRPDKLGGDNPSLTESLPTTPTQEVPEQRLRKRRLEISHPRVLPHG